jgi:hypothetical protein
MGSIGTGKFTDYPGSAGGHPGKGQKGKGGGGRGGGGGGGGDRCDLAIHNLALDEVATSEYFRNHGHAPRTGTQVRVRGKLVGSRIAVETSGADEVVGYMPTEYNYLRQCMSRGYKYEGNVASSLGGLLPQVTVDLTPTK